MSQNKRYYLEHKVEIDERNKQNYYKNRAYIRQYQQDYYEKNKISNNFSIKVVKNITVVRGEIKVLFD